MHAAVHCLPRRLADSAERRLLRFEACLDVHVRRLAVVAFKPKREDSDGNS